MQRCPASFNTSTTRLANTYAPCEPNDIRQVSKYIVKAGERIKVGWVSGNAGGGFVRLALAPAADMTENNFNQSVLKVTCFGYDSRPGKYAFGICIHPCNGYGGCEYQQDIGDTQRYDTSITIPTNLKDGDYVLQFLSVPGRSVVPIYSCSMLTITGGNPNLDCPRPFEIPQPSDCVTTASGMLSNNLLYNSSPGKFCFNSNSVGGVDDTIGIAPVNQECDARQSCQVSMNQAICSKELVSTNKCSVAEINSIMTNAPISSNVEASSTMNLDSATKSIQSSPTIAISSADTKEATIEQPSTKSENAMPSEPTSTSPPIQVVNSGCIKNGTILSTGKFCQFYISACSSICTTNEIITVGCKPVMYNLWGIEASCKCKNEDYSKRVKGYLIPFACL